MNKLQQILIIKHALTYYLNRPGEEEFKPDERRLLRIYQRKEKAVRRKNH